MTPLKLFNVHVDIGIFNIDVDTKHFQLYHKTLKLSRGFSNITYIYGHNYTVAEICVI